MHKLISSLRNAILHLALFIPWEAFLDEIPDDFATLWTQLSQNLSSRLKFHVRNICLLRKSAEDAKADARLWKKLSDGDQTGEGAFEDEDEEAAEQDYCINDVVVKEHYFMAFRKILEKAIRKGEVTERSPDFMRIIQATNPIVGNFPELLTQTSRSRNGDFYNEIQRDNDRAVGMANLGKSQIKRLDKLQKILDEAVTKRISGENTQDSIQQSLQVEQILHLGPGSTVQLRTGSFKSYISAAEYSCEIWSLNKLQSQAVMQPFEFLERCTANGSAQEQRQYLMYLGGAGGTGKSRVIEAIHDVFRILNCERQLVLTASSGSAAAKIQGVTVHSALSIPIDDESGTRKITSVTDNQIRQISGISEKQLKTAELWEYRRMLIIDEISMISGVTLSKINKKCGDLGEKQQPFGGIPVVIFTGDFYQFPPVMGMSLLKLPTNVNESTLPAVEEDSKHV